MYDHHPYATDISEYLVNSFNYEVYSSLLIIKPISSEIFKETHINELGFFNQLFEYFDNVKQNRDNPRQLTSTPIFYDLEVSPIQREMFHTTLLNLIDKEQQKELDISGRITKAYSNLKICRVLIEKFGGIDVSINYSPEATKLISNYFSKYFDIKRVVEHVNTLRTSEERVKYVKEKREEFDRVISLKTLQEIYSLKTATSLTSVSFDKQCEITLKFLNGNDNIEPSKPQLDKLGPKFSLSSTRGTKTNLIRILNSMYHLKLFTLPDGSYPTKEYFMKSLGDFFGSDLSSYDVDLNQTYDVSLESNIKIFEKLKNIYQDEWSKRNH